MGGGRSPTPVADDWRINPGEKLWRLIEGGWYRSSGQGSASIQEAAFIGEVSLLRQVLVSSKDVDAVQNGKFVKYGIAELEADEIRGKADCFLRITADNDWPTDAHLLVLRKNGSKRLRATHPEVPELTGLANAKPLLRLPTP